jgi:lariat debranching enzyme
MSMSDTKEHVGLRICVEGCGHGELDKIYDGVRELEAQGDRKIDLVICCGDFQSVRNMDDLECMACPAKFKQLGSFYKYYSGEKVAPYPTLFIGGNHEAINYLRELYYGGWAAPNIYFLGYSGVVQFGGLRIAGLSGIYKKQDYLKGHFEVPPYSPGNIRSAYHVKCMEINKLMGVQGHLDVFLSHDWPSGITIYGDQGALLKRKRFLARDIAQNSLGSPPSMSLLKKLQPTYWFSAHLHTKFEATVPHDSPGKFTQFLSLDKCLPGRKYLQVVDFPSAHGSKIFRYDEEWLAIIRQTHGLTQFSQWPSGPPAPISPPSHDDIKEVERMFQGNLDIPPNFVQSAKPYDGEARKGVMPQSLLENAQTTEFLKRLELDPIDRLEKAIENPESIDIDDSEDETDPAIKVIIQS